MLGDTRPPYTLRALDGADSDGGTLYVLLDRGIPVKAAAWPQPLEELAATQGRRVERIGQPAAYGPDDHDDERELLADLMAQVAQEA